MRRGDIWTVAGGKDYAGKPRPVVIVQDDSFDATGLDHHLRLHNMTRPKPRCSACLWNRMSATACGRHAA